MADKPKAITEKEFRKVIMQLITANIHLELKFVALEQALTESGVLSQEQLHRVRERVEQLGKGHLDSLTQPTFEKLVAMLPELKDRAQ